jgi:hypothetical protein
MKMAVSLAALALCAPIVRAQAPGAIPPILYGGSLKLSDDTLLNNDECRITFRLYDAAGNRVWYEVKEPVRVKNGAYTVSLGSPGNELTQSMFASPAFLEVQVGDDKPLPLQPMGLGYSFVPLTGNSPILKSSTARAIRDTPVKLDGSNARLQPTVVAADSASSPGVADVVVTRPYVASNTSIPALQARAATLSTALSSGADTSTPSNASGSAGAVEKKNPITSSQAARVAWIEANKNNGIYDKNGELLLDKVPIFMTNAEAANKTEFTNWNRLHGGTVFIPRSGVTPFVLVESAFGRYKAKVIQENPESEGGGFNIDKPVDVQRLPYSVRLNHWGNLTKRSRWHTALGVSASKVGDNKASTDDKTAFFLGGAYSINPYINLNFGSVIQRKESGIRLRPAFGFSLDIGSLSTIFNPSPN